MDICDLLRRDTPCDQFVTNIVIHAEVAFFFKRFDLSNRLLILSIIGIFALDRCFCCLVWNTQITEDDLRKPVLSRFSVDTGYVLNAPVQLRIRVILKGRINQSRIKTELSSVRRNFEHIVDRRINISCIDSVSSVGKLLNKFPLKGSSFDLDHLIITIRYIEFQRIRSTNISDLLEHTHQFGQTCIVSDTGALLEAIARRFQLIVCFLLTEHRNPIIEVLQAVVFQEIVFQVTHHGVQLGNGIAQRCASCKDNALAACLFIEVSAFEEKIKCFLRSRVGNSGYILQFCGDKEVLELVGFIDEQTVDTELFKGQSIVLTCFL